MASNSFLAGRVMSSQDVPRSHPECRMLCAIHLTSVLCKPSRSPILTICRARTMASASASTPHCRPSKQLAIMWFRNDLRLEDNQSLLDACQSDADYLLPVYCLDTGLLQARPDIPELGGIPTLGPHKLRCASSHLLMLALS